MTPRTIGKNWRVIAIIVAAVAVLYAAFNFLLMPRLESWVLAQIPGSAAVQKTLESHFPQYQISMYANTSYGSNNQKQRTLTIGVSGGSFLAPDQVADSKNLICSALGQDAQKYVGIYLRDAVVHNFLFFYSSQSQTQTITCK